MVLKLHDKFLAKLGHSGPALHYSLAYAIIGALWIFSSDQLLGFIVHDPNAVTQLQSYKGFFFIGISALLFYFLLAKVQSQATEKSTSDPQLAPPSRLITAALLLLTLAIAGSGYALYQSAQQAITKSTTANLANVTELKLSQIKSWLDEGHHHITQKITSPAFLSALQAWQESPSSNAKQLLAHLNQLSSVARFQSASLYSAEGTLLLSTDSANASPKMKIDATRAAGIIDDFDLSSQGEIVFGLLSPLPSQSPPAVWIRVTLDRSRQLSSLLQKWPDSSQSTETLLVRREGKEIVFLGPIGHPTSQQTLLRMPITTPDLISAQLLGGKRGEILGLDYRQVPSLAYGAPLSGTSWFILSKTDATEAYADLNLIATCAAALLVTLLLLSTWTVAMRHNRLVSSHRRELASLLLAKHYEVLVKYANDCIIIVDAKHRIIDINERCERIYGYCRAEMLTMADTELLSPEARNLISELPQNSEGPDSLLYETKHRRKDGSLFPVEISEVTTEIDGEMQIHRIVRDITERKMSEARIEQLSRLSVTLSTLNHAIAHSKNLDEVFDITCRACVQQGGFKLAWIGLADRESNLIRVANIYGEDMDFLDDIVINISPDQPEKRSPSAIAFHEQRTCICDNFAHDPLTKTWHKQAERYGIGASVSLPISRDEIPMGVLTAYSDHANSFDPQGEYLLGEIAEGLSFAMHHFAELAAKRETEEALKVREAQLLKAEELAKLGHWEIDLITGKKIWSPQMYRLFERNPAQGPAEPEEAYALYYTPESGRLTQQGVREAIRTGERVYIEQELHFPDNRTAYHSTVIAPLRDKHGKTIALHGTVQDTTEHKLHEVRLSKMASRLAQAAREYEDLYQNAPCGYHSLDKDGVFQRINETELRWLGYSRAEVIGKMKFSDVLPPKRVPAFQRHFPDLMKTGELHDLEQNLVCKDGSILPVLINATVIRDDAGNFLMSRSTTYNMTERKKRERERDEYMGRLNHLSRRLLNMQEEERKRLSASLHDRTSPNLAAIGLNLSIINMSCAEEISQNMAERLQDIKALLEDTTASIREISADLRPPLLDYAGLIPALEGYLYQFSKRTGTQTHFECANVTARPSPEIETLLFRITQEALTNCAKHANANTIEVTLQNDKGSIVLDIKDDGTGFDPGSLGKNGNAIGLGMLNMREMTEFAGGQFVIDTHPGRGTSIHVEL